MGGKEQEEEYDRIGREKRVRIERKKEKKKEIKWNQITLRKIVLMIVLFDIITWEGGWLVC